MFFICFSCSLCTQPELIPFELWTTMFILKLTLTCVFSLDFFIFIMKISFMTSRYSSRDISSVLKNSAILTITGFHSISFGSSLIATLLILSLASTLIWFVAILLSFNFVFFILFLSWMMKIRKNLTVKTHLERTTYLIHVHYL